MAPISEAMRSVEVKHELRDPALAEAILRRLGAMHVSTCEQTDTYFRVTDGRLKKREAPGEPTEWIFYHREDTTRPRVSRFAIYSHAEAMGRFGSRGLPAWRVVRKRRSLWLRGPVRVHVDRVRGLGDFVEFEAMVTKRQPPTECARLVEEVRSRFLPLLGEAVSRSYSDLVDVEAA